MPSGRRALITGLGLIGGSIGIVLRRHGWHVTYLDPGVSLDDASRAGAADERSDSLESALDGPFDINVLAAPVDAAIAAIDRCRSLTTSVCSVLQPLRSAADAHGVDFVAGHPLAGSQERGLSAARAELFEGASWFVDREAPVVQELIACCGARPELVNPAEHDRAVALTSHLPQILSTALAAYLHGQRIDPRFAGSGLRTFLRLAGSAASVWSPIIAANRENIAPHTAEVAEIVRTIVERGDDEAFTRANEWNASLAASSRSSDNSD